MAAGKVEAEHLAKSTTPLTRTTFTTCGPFSFIRQTKQILEEVQEKKENLYKSIALELRSVKNSEFYDVIDSLPGNEDVFEVLRIKQLVRDSIQTADREIQDKIKQQLKNEDMQNDFVPSENGGEESDPKSKMLSSNTTLQSSSSSLSHLKQDSKSRSVKLTGIKGVTATKKKPMLDPKKRSALGLKGCHQPSSTSQHMVNQLSGSASQIRNNQSLSREWFSPEEQTVDAQYMPATSEVNIPRNVPLFQQYKAAVVPNPNIRNIGISGGIGTFSDKNKYFPSAVPLGPPTRQKSEERASDFTDKTETGHSDAPPNLTKRSNVAVVTVQSHDVNQKNLTCQALPSISIEGKSKGSGFQRINVKNIVFQEELSEKDSAVQHSGNSSEKQLSSFDVDVENKHQEEDSDFSLKHSLNDVGYTDNRRIFHQVRELNGSQKTPENTVDLEEEIGTDILENLILDVITEDLWSVCSEVKKSCQPSLESSTLPQNGKEMFDAEIQVQNSLVELVDQEIQAAAELPEFISECVQTSLSGEPTETVSAGTQVSRSLDKDLENELPPVVDAVTVVDVSVQTSLELRNESDTEPKLLAELQDGVSLAINDVVLDSNTSLPSVAGQQHAQDAKCGSPLLSQIGNAEELPGNSQRNSSVTVSSSHRTDVVELEEVASEHDVIQSDLDVLPQKEQSLAEDEERSRQLSRKSSVLLDSEDEDWVFLKDLSRFDPVQKMSDSEPSVSEKTSGLTVSASTTISDADFMEGLISEGECILQSHLRLLSLLGKESTQNTGGPKRNQEKETGECSLSEGEIPTRNLNALGGSHAKFSTTTLTGGSVASINSVRNREKETSENSLSDGEIPVRNLKRLIGDHRESSLSEGEIPVRNLNRCADNQRNLPVVTLTGHFEETVPVKLTAEKPSTLSDSTFDCCALSLSEGEIYPLYGEFSKKSGLHHHAVSGRNQISLAKEASDRKTGSPPSVLHLQPNPRVPLCNPACSKCEVQNTACDAHLGAQDNKIKSSSYDFSSQTQLPKSSTLRYIPPKRNSTKSNVTEHQSQATTSLPQVMCEIRGFHSSHRANATNS